MNTDKRMEILFRMGLNQGTNKRNIMVHNGHSIFKMNVDSLEISLAETELVEVKNPKTGKVGNNVKVKHEPGYIYIPALNIKSAIKKFNKVVAYANYQASLIPDAVDQSHISSLKGEGQIDNNNP